ncbi:class I SAM-dependent methyltransferase [Pseudaestuariivita sp.]|uniref:class I SAM-dependent methyltransferase n=1 Tax=Pseudaestuariivita sp. TaxID=2211669 RepID=UPI004059B38B
MSEITAQYDAYPYPERDPKDEAKRLITGSPSHPVEIDHMLFGGARDWSQPFRALVAGGGTGDALIQLAQVLTTAKVPHEITYIDLSREARRIAEARAKARGLTSITFHTGSLLDAPEHGTFDYIDCCGVLHHLPDPLAGLKALRAACKPEGGLGWMVYAPYGRSGVYPLQEAFGALFEGLEPRERLTRAKALFAKLPDGHPFKRNTQVVDHEQSDAGFYDLLLHSQDQAYGIDTWEALLAEAGFAMAGLCPPVLYDLRRLTDAPDGMTERQTRAMAERLNGTIRKHVGYARPADATAPKGAGPRAVPHLIADAAKLAKAVSAGKPVPVAAQGVSGTLSLPRETAPFVARITGRHTVQEIGAALRLDPFAAQARWAEVRSALEPWGLVRTSGLLRPRGT